MLKLKFEIKPKSKTTIFFTNQIKTKTFFFFFREEKRQLYNCSSTTRLYRQFHSLADTPPKNHHKNTGIDCHCHQWCLSSVFFVSQYFPTFFVLQYFPTGRTFPLSAETIWKAENCRPVILCLNLNSLFAWELTRNFRFDCVTRSMTPARTNNTIAWFLIGLFGRKLLLGRLLLVLPYYFSNGDIELFQFGCFFTSVGTTRGQGIIRVVVVTIFWHSHFGEEF